MNEKMTMEMLNNIFTLCMEINGTEMKGEDEPQVFFSYSPNACSLCVRVYRDGWAKGKKELASIDLYTDEMFSYKKYTALCEYLEEVKNDIR